MVQGNARDNEKDRRERLKQQREASGAMMTDYLIVTAAIHQQAPPATVALKVEGQTTEIQAKYKITLKTDV